MKIEEVLKDYPHLELRKCWELRLPTALALGECVGLIDSLGEFPLTPEVHEHLHQVALSRGAQATTAIEGNTLTDDEVRLILEKRELPPSRQYQVQELQNAIDAMNEVGGTVFRADGEGKRLLVTPELICSFHKLIGKNLGEVFDAVPGKFRTDRRHVGRYLAPPHEVVPELVKRLCDWLRDAFTFSKGSQSIDEAIQQAIAAHVYFEWIHPFGDGNGRTGRLIEFFILLRAGFPDICAHVLANHYNNTRQEYTHHFDKAKTKRNISEFLEYSITGLRDGLKEVMQQVQEGIFKVAWRSYVYDKFSEYKDYRKKTVFTRRRDLALAMPLNETFHLGRLIASDLELYKQFEVLGKRAAKDDMEVIVKLGLAESLGTDFFRATTEALQAMKSSSVQRANSRG